MTGRLHHQVGGPARALEAEEGGDVGMVERSEQPRLALESGAAVGIAQEGFREDLDRDVTPERAVAGTVHLAHAPGPSGERISYGPSHEPAACGTRTSVVR